MNRNYVFDDYGNSVPIDRNDFFHFDDDDNVSFSQVQEPVGCQHTPKKVVVSANLKFYVCTKCKEDLGDA